jgi:hypothetical protein
MLINADRTLRIHIAGVARGRQETAALLAGTLRSRRACARSWYRQGAEQALEE